MDKILIIDDNAGQLEFLDKTLCRDFTVTTEQDPLRAFSLIGQHEFDAIVIDVHMPIISGFDFVKKLRTQNKVSLPIFILSSDKSYDTRIQALNLEIKDFLYPEMTKEELVLRIKNHLHLDAIEKKDITYKDVCINPLTLSVYVNDKKIELTLTEFKIIKFLVSHHNKYINKTDLKNEVWSNTSVMDKTLNSHLTNLRAKLSTSAIQLKSDKTMGIILF